MYCSDVNLSSLNQTTDITALEETTLPICSEQRIFLFQLINFLIYLITRMIHGYYVINERLFPSHLNLVERIYWRSFSNLEESQSTQKQRRELCLSENFVPGK